MSSSFGTIYRLTTWGESHGAAVGCVVDGCPAGLDLAEQDIQRELDRRRVGQSKVSSARQEPDKVQILSGVFEGRTTGTPISMLVMNTDAKSSHYDNIKDLYRPGHADYSWDVKYGFRDHRGGGRSSARETIGRVAGGAIARLLLARAGVKIVGWTAQLGDLVAQVRLQLVDVPVVDGRGLRDVGPPLRDPCLHTVHRSGLSQRRRHPAGAPPDVTQRPRDGHPLPLLLRERRAPVVGDRVVPSAPLVGRRPPLGGHVSQPAEAMEQRVEHPVGPLELTPGELAHPLQDGVAVALALGEDREHERCRRRRDEVLVDVHDRSSDGLKPYA